MRNEFDKSDPWNPFQREDTTPPCREAARRVGPAVKECAVDAFLASADSARRRYDRVAGPFDGCRVGLIETPVRIYDLSLGGCFVNSMHEQRDGSMMVLKIELPQEGWITVNAEMVYRRPGFGFAVRFVDVGAETSACLVRAIDALKGVSAGNS